MGTKEDNLDDISLWCLVRKGDAYGASVLYRRHYNLMLNFGMKFVHDADFVRDCIQDLFVKILSSRKLSDTHQVLPYLLTALRNVISDRCASARATDMLDEHSFNIRMDDSGLERLFGDNDETLLRSKQLLASYNSLNENQRIAIYLRFVRGLSYKEIGAVLEINTQSSMNLVSRALAKLRKLMSGRQFILISLQLSSLIIAQEM